MIKNIKTCYPTLSFCKKRWITAIVGHKTLWLGCCGYGTAAWLQQSKILRKRLKKPTKEEQDYGYGRKNKRYV